MIVKDCDDDITFHPRKKKPRIPEHIKEFERTSIKRNSAYIKNRKVNFKKL